MSPDDRPVTDSEGNTFLHLALWASKSKHCLPAVQNLIDKGLVQDNWNTDEHVAVDYLATHNIQCAEPLINFFIKRMKIMTPGAARAAAEKIKKFQWLDSMAKSEKKAQERKAERPRHIETPAQQSVLKQSTTSAEVTGACA